MNKKIISLIIIFVLGITICLSGCISNMKKGYVIKGYISDISTRDIDGRITHYVFLIDDIGYVTLVYDELYTNTHFNFNYRGNATIEFGKLTDGFTTEDVLISMVPESQEGKE